MNYINKLALHEWFNYSLINTYWFITGWISVLEQISSEWFNDKYIWTHKRIWSASNFQKVILQGVVVI